MHSIETIRAGDFVLSANAETMQKDYKPVLETYVRQVDRLVHLTVNVEEIITTVDHPFYVNGQGFVNAVDLCIGSELVDRNGNILKVEHIFRDSLHDENCDVYNFKVDEWHTYFVGNNSVLVHNAGSEYMSPSEQAKSWQGTGKYPGIDEYTDVTVNKGTGLYRGEPNGSEYFTTLDAINDSGRSSTTLFEDLQVEKHPIFGYRLF